MRGKEIIEGFHLPILLYHHISDEIHYYTSISKSSFKRQLEQALKDFQCISLKDAFAMYQRAENPDNRFALTFDDGYSDTLPILRNLADEKIPTTLFVNPATIGKDNRWNYKAPYFASCLSEEDLKEIIAMGHSVHSHGMTHQNLTKLPDDELAFEISESQRVLNERLNIQAIFYAYPFGFFDTRVKNIVKKSYTAAFATDKTASSKLWIDPFQIHRLSVYTHTPTSEILGYLNGAKNGNS